MDLYRLFVPRSDRISRAALSDAVDRITRTNASARISTIGPVYGWHGRQVVDVITVAGETPAGRDLLYLGQAALLASGTSVFMDRTSGSGATYRTTLITLAPLITAAHALGLTLDADPFPPRERPDLRSRDITGLSTLALDEQNARAGVEGLSTISASGPHRMRPWRGNPAGVEGLSKGRPADIGPRKPFVPDLASDHYGDRPGMPPVRGGVAPAAWGVR